MMPMNKAGWIGFDLDGVLAFDTPNRSSQTVIGQPIDKMIQKAREWIAKGFEVRLFTARAFNMTEETRRALEQWCLKHIGIVVPITACKDKDLLFYYDDKAIQVIRDRGETLL